jgi:hypothetical protein
MRENRGMMCALRGGMYLRTSTRRGHCISIDIDSGGEAIAATALNH